MATAYVLADSDVPQFTDYSKINQGPPEVSYRNRDFRAYLPNNELRKRLKTSPYSSFENPTGIFFSRDETVSLNVKGGAGKNISLIVHDFDKSGSHDVYPLNEGSNVIQIKSSGLGYINYRSDQPEQEPPVHITIDGGKINGVFTPQDDAETWERLLASAKCNILDLLGTRCQLAYDVESLRKYCPHDGPELLALYDRIIEMEQNDVLGWKLDGSHPGNHIHGRVQWKGFMHADGYGAAFHVSAMDCLDNPKKLRKNTWGVAHEFGHLNQTRPGMMWIGMTEVTNNLCSSWVSYQLTPGETRLEHEVSDTLDSVPMRGGNFDSYVNSAIVEGQIWQFQAGTDPALLDIFKKLKRQEIGKVFVTLAPFWQLLLYNHLALGNKDFYPRIYHDVRVTDESKMTNGELRVLFMKRACDAAQLNFSKFFIKTGMAAAIDREVGEYGVAFVTVTEDMVQEMLDYVAKYPEPESDVIYYITVNSVDIFRDKLPIEVSPDAPKIKLPVKQVDIPPDAWKNAVAFEAYSGEKLIRVSLRGLNHEDNETTTVICPPETDSLKAVQWDGKRITIAKLSDDPETRKKWQKNVKMAKIGRAVTEGNADKLKSLLKGVNVNDQKFGNGNSLLSEAIERQNAQVVKLLLESGANPKEVDRDGRLPLHRACRHDNEEIVKLLLKAGADPMAQSENSAYPIHEAIWCEKNHLLPILLPYYKKINFSPDGGGNGYPAAMAIKRGNEEALRILLKAGLKVNDERFSSNPLLTLAVKEGKETMVRMLLKAKAKKSVVDAEGKRAIDYATGDILELLR